MADVTPVQYWRQVIAQRDALDVQILDYREKAARASDETERTYYENGVKSCVDERASYDQLIANALEAIERERAQRLAKAQEEARQQSGPDIDGPDDPDDPGYKPKR